MEKKQTAVNELLTWIKEKNNIAKRDFSNGACDYYTIRMIEIIEAKINSMKEIEQSQILKTWYDCKLSIILKEPKDALDYYNEIYVNANN